MLKEQRSSCDAAKPKIAWWPLAAVLVLFLVSRVWQFLPLHGSYGLAHGMASAILLSFWEPHFIKEIALFSWLALFSFMLFGFLWHKSLGIKRYIYYIFFAFFALQYGGGAVIYLVASHPFGSPPPAPRYFVIFWATWLAFLLAVILYEFMSRLRR